MESMLMIAPDNSESGAVLMKDVPKALKQGYKLATWMKNPKGESVAVPNELASQFLYAGFVIDHSKSSAE